MDKSEFLNQRLKKKQKTKKRLKSNDATFETMGLWFTLTRIVEEKSGAKFL